MIALSFKFKYSIRSLLAFTGGCCCCAISLHSETKPFPISPQVSQDIGEAALSVASKRFSKDRADPVGYKLLALSESLCSKKDNIFYLKGLLDSGSPIKPLIFGPITNEQALAKYLTKFAGSLKKPSYFQLVLLSSASMLDPKRRDLLIALQRAKRRGLDMGYYSLLRNARNPLPLSGMTPPFAPELDKNHASTLAMLSTEFAASKLAGNIDSLEAKRMLYLGLLVDPENEHLLYLLALLDMGRVDQIPVTKPPDDLLLTKLIETSRRRDNSFSLNLLLHRSILILKPDRFDSVVFLQKAKELGRSTNFERIAMGYEQARRDQQRIFPEKPKTKPVSTRKVLDASLSNLLVGKQWNLVSKQTNETWFFRFRRTTSSIFSPEGKCEGTRGNKLHTWNSWKIKDGILIIDGYAKYLYDQQAKNWKQADGKKDSILR
jgi:hypothetical protein